jgi:Flp pilus assembly protein TadD
MTVRLCTILLLTGVAGCASLSNSTIPPDIPPDATSTNDKFDALIRMAHDVEMQGSEDTALVLYRQAVMVSGHAPAAYVQLGDACVRARKFIEATEAYRAALATDPHNAAAQLGLGTVLVQRGNFENGVTELAKAAPLVNTGAAYNRLGVAQTMAGEFSKAQEAFEKGLGVAPDDIDITTNLALAAALAGDVDKAARLADRIATSPAAKSLHRRNLVIVFGIIGKSSRDAKTVAPKDLSQSAFDALFKRAASIRTITDPIARAHALGAIQS